jgi:error-prone DNA polymerase
MSGTLLSFPLSAPGGGEERAAAAARYAELQITSNFTFLEGASHPEEMAGRAALLGLEAFAITDRNSFAGIVRAHVAAKELGIRLIVGLRLDLTDGASLLAYPTTREAYGLLCRLVTIGRRRGPKGHCPLNRRDVRKYAKGSVLIAIPPEDPDEAFAAELRDWAALFPGDVYLAMSHRLRGDDEARLTRLAALAEACDIAAVAVGDVLMHRPERQMLADVLTCIREKCLVDQAGLRLQKNAERHLKPASVMAALFRHHPEALARGVEIADRCRFNLDELRYEYPHEITTGGRTPQEELVHLTEKGLRERYPNGVPEKVRKQVDHEYALIAERKYAPFFLTVYDIVSFARSKDILCQGRGSAANSAVCYYLGITAVDPGQHDLLFERFLSPARNEPPDIDVDFEHERREEVIQYVYDKYGRHRAGLAATVIHYRARRAIREVGKALGLSEDTVGAMASQIWGWSENAPKEDWIRKLGLDPSDHRLGLILTLVGELIGFPRHLSQHVGGFVITERRLDESVPVEKASMEGRTVIEWDKDDLDALGMLKVDVLALGMLTCIRKSFDLIQRHYGKKLTMKELLQANDKKTEETYDMLCRADSLGVFQVESRAQMSFLPRMKPRIFYDLAIQVAIVRPGPIQGNMVHPYLRRRNKEEPETYEKPELREVLKRTKGVPLFQEQAMQIAMVAAGFTAQKADELRRAMATFRHTGNIPKFKEPFISGMLGNGYSRDFAERCFSQIEGFGEYGFPESHAISFALLVYVSAWIKRHHPAVFACALLNSQPMGFYAPAQIIRDAREHGVEVRAADVNDSQWDCTLEDGSKGKALRLGLRQIKGIGGEEAKRIVENRGNGYADVDAVWRRARIHPRVIDMLTRGDAFTSIDLKRRQALWQVKRLPGGGQPLPLFAAANATDLGEEKSAALPEMTLGEEVVADYQALRLSLRKHPLELLRPSLPAVTRSKDLEKARDGRRVEVAGLVLVRQQPGSAKGVIFITLEDETGVVNVVVWQAVFQQFRRQVMTGRLLRIRGLVQKTERKEPGDTIVIHVVAEEIINESELLDSLDSIDPLEPPYAHADGPTRSPYADSRGGPSQRRSFRHSGSARHPREQAKRLFPSRDFH